MLAVARAMQWGASMLTRSTINSAFTSVLVEAGRVRDEIDFAAWCREVRNVDRSLTMLGDALDDPRPDDLPIERQVRFAEDAASSEMWPLLKRPDEKYVTERAYDNPKFVEDMVRDIALALNREERIAA